MTRIIPVVVAALMVATTPASAQLLWPNAAKPRSVKPLPDVTEMLDANPEPIPLSETEPDSESAAQAPIEETSRNTRTLRIYTPTPGDWTLTSNVIVR